MKIRLDTPLECPICGSREVYGETHIVRPERRTREGTVIPEVTAEEFECQECSHTWSQPTH